MNSWTHCLTIAGVALGLVMGAGTGAPRALPKHLEADGAKESSAVEVKQLDKLVGTWGPASNKFVAMTAKWTVAGTCLQIDKRFARSWTVRPDLTSCSIFKPMAQERMSRASTRRISRRTTRFIFIQSRSAKRNMNP